MADEGDPAQLDQFARAPESSDTERLMMSKIFINFRNGDGEWAAEALRVVLEQRFGKDHVFLSHESIPIGAQWPDALLDNARTCDVFLALIGPKWLSIKGADGRPRIFAEHDWVRREIAAALAADRTVAPILLGDTPRLDLATDLPDDIRGLALKQGPRLDVRQFDDNYAGLERKLMEIVPRLRPRRLRAGARVNSDLEVGKMDGRVEIVHAPRERDLDITARTKIDIMGPDSLYTVLKESALTEEEGDQGKEERG
jgi:hypothetical protein